MQRIYLALSVISLSQTLITYICGVEHTQWPMDLCPMDGITWISLVLFAQFLLSCQYLQFYIHKIDLIMAMDASLFIRTLNGGPNECTNNLRYSLWIVCT